MVWLGQVWLGQVWLGQVWLGQVWLGHVRLGRTQLELLIFVSGEVKHFIGNSPKGFK